MIQNFNVGWFTANTGTDGTRSVPSPEKLSFDLGRYTDTWFTKYAVVDLTKYTEWYFEFEISSMTRNVNNANRIALVGVSEIPLPLYYGLNHRNLAVWFNMTATNCNLNLYTGQTIVATSADLGFAASYPLRYCKLVKDPTLGTHGYGLVTFKGYTDAAMTIEDANMAMTWDVTNTEGHFDSDAIDAAGGWHYAGVVSEDPIAGYIQNLDFSYQLSGMLGHRGLGGANLMIQGRRRRVK